MAIIPEVLFLNALNGTLTDTDDAASGVDYFLAFKSGEIIKASYTHNNAKDRGATGDGVTSDLSAIDAAATLGAVFLPAGTYSYPGSDFGAALGAKRFFGVGQVKTGANKRAPYFSAISSAPTPSGGSGIDTAFNGDLSKVQFAVEHRITGAATLGQPTTGYQYSPEAYPHYTYLYNSSGHNEATGGNTGRTAAVAHRVNVYQAGQGDAVAFNGSVFVTGTKTGSTHFLANPAGSIFNGDMTAGQAGVYLNVYETSLHDGGFDCAAIGAVYNFDRTVATGAKSAVWEGVRYQNSGAAYCDAVISATGKWKVGLDLAMSTLNFDTTKAAVSLKAGDRIYFNNLAGASGNIEANWRTTTFNDDYIDYDTASARLRVIIGNAAVATFHATQVTNFGNGVNLGSGKTYQIVGTQVVAARKTGWAVAAGTPTRTAFDTATVTLPQLAERVKALIDDLHSTAGHGLIGT